MGHSRVFLALILIFGVSIPTRKVVAQALPCDDVVNELDPCLSYLNGELTSPSKDCCKGAKYVSKHYGRTKTDRQEVCSCLESVLPYVGNVDSSLVSALPRQCKLKIQLPPVTNGFDCSQIQ